MQGWCRGEGIKKIFTLGQKVRKSALKSHFSTAPIPKKGCLNPPSRHIKKPPKIVSKFWLLGLGVWGHPFYIYPLGLWWLQ